MNRMKSLTLFCNCLVFLSFTHVNAQLKVTSTGSVGINFNLPSVNDRLHVEGRTRFSNWTDVFIDWTGMCCGSPVIYPELDWYLQIGKPDKKISIFYLDGNELSRINGQYMDKTMPVILNLSMFCLSGSKHPPVNSNTQFPTSFDIDYLKIYKLKTNNNTCNQNVTLITPSDFNNYVYNVKNNISIGNGTTAVTVPSNIVLRASNEITINNNFEVPLGTEFTAQITSCY